MFSFPTEIFYGKGEADNMPAIVKDLGYRALLVAAKKQLDQFQPIQDIITNLEKNNINVIVFDEIANNSDSATVDTAASLAKSSQCDFIIGVGGDVVLNMAKAIALMITNPGDCSDYLTEQEGYSLKIDNKPLPSVMVPTMLGSICEATPGFLLIDKEDGHKKKLYNSIITPVATVLDPQMTAILPANLIAPSMLMLLSYGVELYISKGSNPVADTFALRTMELVNNYLTSVLKDPNNMDTRMDLMMASLFVSYGAASAKLGAVYSVSESINVFNPRIFKGMIASLLLPQFMEFNLTASSGKYVQVAKVLGENVHKLSVLEAAIKAVEKVRRMVEECNIPSKLSELGFEKNDIDNICRAFTRFSETKHLPRPISGNELKTILDQSY